MSRLSALEARIAALEEMQLEDMSRRAKAESPGKTAVFKCSCRRENVFAPGSIGCGELHVIPVGVNGEKRVDLRTVGAGGVVLSPADRLRLIRILAQQSWFGE